MPFTLRDIKAWQHGVSCTPMSLSALSGKRPDKIAVLLQDASKKHDRDCPKADIRSATCVRLSISDSRQTFT
jgi:hypothetical protein